VPLFANSAGIVNASMEFKEFLSVNTDIQLGAVEFGFESVNRLNEESSELLFKLNDMSLDLNEGEGVVLISR
jgi:hypothetical protein